MKTRGGIVESKSVWRRCFIFAQRGTRFPMFSKDQYELLDFGNGRRLERFGALVLDRLCPSAEGRAPASPERWREADAKFLPFPTSSKSAKNSALGIRGYWVPTSDLGRRYFPSYRDASEAEKASNSNANLPWLLPVGARFVFELKGSPFGHVGVFPEQAENWARIFAFCRQGAETLGRPLKILNLFGYTGGSALAADASGAEVTHLDAARNIVAQAKRNAALSNALRAKLERGAALDFSEEELVLGGNVRWIVDDATKFVKRELKREARYDGIILDPPSYGHGARGEVWRLTRDLAPMLDRCAALCGGEVGFVMLTCHTPSFNGQALERALRDSFEKTAFRRTVRYLSRSIGIRSNAGRTLPSGDLALATFGVDPSARPFC